MEDEHGYWVEDEDDATVYGFYSTESDVLWTHDEKSDEWQGAFIGRRIFRKRRTQSKGKGKKKKRHFRGPFRSYRKGGGKSYLVDEFDNDQDDQDQDPDQSN